jgi:hypothetical protein
MPRIARSLPFIALLALPLLSCFDDVPECPTCPRADGASIEVLVDADGLVDSAQVQVDGGAWVTVKRNQRHVFGNLSSGTHAVATVRWFNDFGIPVSREQSLEIELDRGEARTVLFHNDFPLVVQALPQPRRHVGVPSA